MTAPLTNTPSRTVHVYVRDRNDQALNGAKIRFRIDGEPAGEVASSEGRASLQVPDRSARVEIEAVYGTETQSAALAEGSDSYRFKFEVEVAKKTLFERHVALFVGIGLMVVSLALGFTVQNPSTLQIRLIIAVIALAGGAIATEIPGMLKFDLSLGKRLAIGATGALAVFVILYLMGPGNLTSDSPLAP